MAEKYAIDSNIFISSSRLYYPFDIAPAFWRQLVEKGGERLVIIDRIQTEILRNEDPLSGWLRENIDAFSFGLSQELAVIENYRKMISAVNEEPKYKEVAKRTFAEVADAWLCAHALTYNYTIATEEVYDQYDRSNVKIPNICKEFGIKYINRLEFIRAIGIRFE